ncbi:MAG: eukaryotic-like serine/threonine-protein kinase [Gaiellaceae bacterium]|nr:eukaryotic-like serine/threonine-protein kinase [Gaiellaceae bacterium]
MSTEILAARYRIEQPLGQGGMASVYLARDEELDRPVALKILADNLAGDATFRDRFEREARLAARLSHPNVVRVFDVGESEGRPFIVMEYVEGDTVADELARHGALPPARAVDLALQICSGLEAAHASGLVHRDVKPRNLLLRPDGVLKIADFGIARAAESTRLTEIGTILGTAAYLAPEQAEGLEATPAADLYSVGAVLYELLTGRVPYAATSLVELLAKQQAGPPAPIGGVPASLELAVVRCLDPDPAERPPSAAALAGELAAAQAPTVPHERGAPGPPALHVGSQRRRWGVLVLLALALVALYFVVRSRNTGTPAPPAPAKVAPIPVGATPAEEARNLAAWLRARARG